MFAATLILAAPVASNAQETTSAIRGKVLDPSGAPVANASVVVKDLRSGVQRTYATNDSGVFLAARLLPGGPYNVTVNATKSVDVATISVGDIYSLTINMQEEEAIEEIIAVGQAAALVEVASGPSATFDIDDIEASVAFNRDISDVYEIDPRLNVDSDQDSFALNCVGKHPRFNKISLDGVSQTDRFGLNSNNYSTAVGLPFPFDAIENIAVELAPFDVTYSGFSACNINAVTKSGTDEWEGKVFYEFSNNDLRGDTVADDPTDYGRDSYDKTYLGFNVGGPILADRLYVFAAYEEAETPRFLRHGYAGSGNGEERSWLSEADYNRIRDIAMDPNIYDYDPGTQPGDGTQDEEKYMLRLDWFINDDHNAAFIYNFYDGSQLRDSDGSDSNELEFSNHFYTKGAENEQFTLKLNSQWTDAFSTEIFFNTSEMTDSQVTVGPKDFADMQISVGGRAGTVYLGADDSRQANNLATDSTYFKLSGQYLMGDHVITAGYDREELEVFNIFVQHSNGGEYDFFDDSAGDDPNCAALTAQQRFDGQLVPDSDGDLTNDACNPSGIDRFELGRPSRIYYGSGGGTNNALDAAANFTNTKNSLYIQDEIFFDNYDLTVTAGLRYEWFESSDRPVFNQTFTDANGGLRNDANIDGIDLIMPRVGFTWGVRDDLELRGGFGLYGGGNPNVWISNAWSNDGLTNAQFTLNNFGGGFTVLPGFADSIELSRDGRPGYDVPQSLVQRVLDVSADDANDSRIVLIDPKYKQPSEWKFAFGGTWDTQWQDVIVEFDFLHSRGNDPAQYVDLSQSVVGLTAAGTPIYDYTNGSNNFMLTNSSETPVSNVLMLMVQKSFGDVSLQLGYSYTDAEDVVPMTSAVAESNFENVALLDINNPLPASSNYVVPHRFTMQADWRANLWGDNETRVTLRGYVNEGQPQSYAMNGSDLEGDGFFGRHLLYVPTGPDDPFVVFAPGFDQDAFFSWVRAEGLSSGFQKRNDQHAGWSSRFDLRVHQEFMLPGNIRGRAYLKIYNFGNFLNDDWGKITDAEFFTPEIVGASVDDQGRFVFESFSNRSIETTVINRSLWEARIGVDFRFGGF